MSTDHDKPHFGFVVYHNINVKEIVFIRARAEKGIVRHIDASSMVWPVIDNGKLANQIARLPATVVKYFFDHCNVMKLSRTSNFIGSIVLRLGSIVIVYHFLRQSCETF